MFSTVNKYTSFPHITHVYIGYAPCHTYLNFCPLSRVASIYLWIHAHANPDRDATGIIKRDMAHLPNLLKYRCK